MHRPPPALTIGGRRIRNYTRHVPVGPSRGDRPALRDLSSVYFVLPCCLLSTFKRRSPVYVLDPGNLVCGGIDRPAPHGRVTRGAGTFGRGRGPSQSAHLKNIRQVTFGFSLRARAIFSPDGRSIIFQAVLILHRRFSITRNPMRMDIKSSRVISTTIRRPKWSARVKGAAPARSFTRTASRSCSPRPT